MTQVEMLQLVEQAFPHLPRPAPYELPFHDGGCAHCEMTVQELMKHPGPELPDSAIRWLCDEQSTFSAKATLWVLPSYLRYVLTREDARNPRPTEFLIYQLSPSQEYIDETRQRLSLLTLAQIRTLMLMVDWWKQDPHWSDFTGESLDRASGFLQTILNSFVADPNC